MLSKKQNKIHRFSVENEHICTYGVSTEDDTLAPIFMFPLSCLSFFIQFICSNFSVSLDLANNRRTVIPTQMTKLEYNSNICHNYHKCGKNDQNKWSKSSYYILKHRVIVIPCQGENYLEIQNESSLFEKCMFYYSLKRRRIGLDATTVQMPTGIACG